MVSRGKSQPDNVQRSFNFYYTLPAHHARFSPPNSCLSLHPSSASTVSTPDRTDTGEAAVLSAALGDLRRSCCNPIQAQEPRHRLRLRAGTVCVAMNPRCSKCVKVKDVVGRDKDGGEFHLTCTQLMS